MEIGLGSRAYVEARECTDVGLVAQYWKPGHKYSMEWKQFASDPVHRGGMGMVTKKQV